MANCFLFPKFSRLGIWANLDHPNPDHTSRRLPNPFSVGLDSKNKMPGKDRNPRNTLGYAPVESIVDVRVDVLDDVLVNVKVDLLVDVEVDVPSDT